MTRLWGPTPPSVHPSLLFASLPSCLPLFFPPFSTHLPPVFLPSVTPSVIPFLPLLFLFYPLSSSCPPSFSFIFDLFLSFISSLLLYILHPCSFFLFNNFYFLFPYFFIYFLSLSYFPPSFIGFLLFLFYFPSFLSSLRLPQLIFSTQIPIHTFLHQLCVNIPFYFSPPLFSSSVFSSTSFLTIVYLLSPFLYFLFISLALSHSS